MTIELTPEQQAVLKETAPFEDPAAFQTALDGAQPEMSRIVLEVMEPAQGIETTITECRDLYLQANRHKTELADVNYGPARRVFFRDAIRLAATANLWFSEGKRTGAFRTRTVEEVVQASRPWRARLKALGEQAFVFEPIIATQFADVNTTGTIEEEKADLQTLIDLATQHEARLTAVSMKPGFVAQGKALLDEASGHGLLGILGLRNQQEALALRNRIFTYATLLAREARAAGVNAFFDDAETRRRFEAASFRNALRRLRPKRRGSVGDGEGGETGGGEKPAKPGEPEGGQPS